MVNHISMVFYFLWLYLVKNMKWSKLPYEFKDVDITAKNVKNKT